MIGELGGERASEDPRGELQRVILESIRVLAEGLEDRQHLVEATIRVAARTPPDANSTSRATLQCLELAATAVRKLPQPVRSRSVFHPLAPPPPVDLASIGDIICTARNVKGIFILACFFVSETTVYPNAFICTL